MNVTLRNDFHNSEVTLRTKVLSHIHHTATAYLTVGQIKKAKHELCGIAGCTCSGEAGTRGPQTLDNGKRLEVNVDAAYATH